MIKDLDVEAKKFPTIISCWGSKLEDRARKESGASEASTSTQATTVKSSLDCHTLKEEYEDTFSILHQVLSSIIIL